MPRRLKVLVSAYACSPYKGSEPGVGWGWVNAIAQHQDVWILTADHHREDIEREIRRAPEQYERVHFHYIPRKRYTLLERIWPPAYLWTYKLWQRAAFEVGKGPRAGALTLIAVDGRGAHAVAEQLRGEAGKRQVPGKPTKGVAQAWGDEMQVGTVIVVGI